MFAGYWRREEATRAAFVDGWFRTGDLAARSPDGYYTLLGRRSDLIISGGFNIYPREIEEFLQEQEDVAEAAVVGVPDRVRGEVPVAYVVPAGERCAWRCWNSECRASLASFKVPRNFIPVEKLPRTAMGKIQKASAARADITRYIERARRMIDREQAWQILCEFTKSEGLRKHALAVETCVDRLRPQARRGRKRSGASRRCCTISIGRSIPTLPDHPHQGRADSGRARRG